MSSDQSPESWQRVKDLLAGALERSPAERSEYLESVCDGDDALHAELVSLLEAYEGRGALPDAAEVRRVGMALNETLQEPLRRKHVGPWGLNKEIGRGGMGVVYLAERVDGEFEQKAAVKLLRFGSATGDLVDRFRTERQVLATLEHPNIARLIDGGVTDEGQPWFAMEYVEGLPITRYCDDNTLTLDERLALFLKVCRAVQHAHNRLIIHRDLKPSNILVTARGEPRVLDFGLAKVLEDSQEDPSTTGLDERWMTLEYASPEQVKGDPVGTPSDTYQLGLILYEMLTGKHPYSVKGLSRTEAERVICEVNPPKPSATVGDDGLADSIRHRPDKLRKRLRGDLDTILMKALHKDPERGYASAEALATDVERHLRSLPIDARPDTIGYRTKTFVRRNRWGVVAAAAIVVSLLGGLGMALWQAGAARAGWDRAEAENQKSEEVTAFLIGLFEANDPNVAQGDTISVREVLERGSIHAESLEDHPELQATLFGVIGKVHHNLGDLDNAEEFYRKALTVWKEGSLQPEGREEYAQALLGLGNTIVKNGRYAEAEPLYRDVIELRAPIGNNDGLYQNALYGRYEALHAMGHTEAAEEAFQAWETTLGLASSVPGVESANHMVELGEILGYRGIIRGDVTLVRRGRALVDSALTVLRVERGPLHPNTGHALNRLGFLYEQEQTLQPAEEVFARWDSVTLQALTVQRAIYEEPHTEMEESLFNRTSVLRMLERYDEAEDLVEEAMEIIDKTKGKEGADWYRGLLHLARINYEQGSYDEAAARYRQIRDWESRQFGETYLYTVTAQLWVSESLSRLGRFEEAEVGFLSAYEVLKDQRGLGDPNTQRAIRSLAELYDAWGKPEQAAEYRALLNAADI